MDRTDAFAIVSGADLDKFDLGLLIRNRVWRPNVMYGFLVEGTAIFSEGFDDAYQTYASWPGIEKKSFSVLETSLNGLSPDESKYLRDVLDRLNIAYDVRITAYGEVLSVMDGDPHFRDILYDVSATNADDLIAQPH